MSTDTRSVPACASGQGTPVARVHSERAPATNTATQATRKEDSLGVISGGGGEGEAPRQRAALAFPHFRCWSVCVSNGGAGTQRWVVARACRVESRF